MYITIPDMFTMCSHVTMFSAYARKQRANRVLGTCRKAVPLQGSSVSDKDLIEFKLSRPDSEAMPYKLLGRYVYSSDLPLTIKDQIYEELHKRHPSVSARTSLFIKEEKARAEAHGNVDYFRQLYKIEKLLAKYPFQGNRLVCENNAIKRFWLGEEMCKKTNFRLRALYRHRDLISDHNRNVLDHARKLIHKVLGPLDISRCMDYAKSGPGMVNTNLPQKPSETTAFFKYTNSVSCTREARFDVMGLVARDPAWLDTCYSKHGIPLNGNRTLSSDLRVLSQHVETLQGNRVTFVPKDASTDRAIAIEPGGNVMLQLGVGTHIKQELKKWGINLFDQSKNQALARLGSIATSVDPFATIDLKMASDTVSIETVRWLLPQEWFSYMNRLRSKEGVLKGESLTYEKFSSMGNGFTFELESLIFFAITHACYTLKGLNKQSIRENIAVFGDDIVCPGSIAEDVIKSLEFFGFAVNHDKTFTKGPFRESCGADFILGYDVRPFFLKRRMSTLRDIHFVCNSIVYKGIKQKSTHFWDAYEFLFRCIPSGYHLPGPMTFSIDLEERSKYHDVDYKEIATAKTLSLESCLRVPLSWAMINGYYNHHSFTQGVRFRELSIRAPKKNKVYENRLGYDSGRYHIFLQGVRQGDIILRGINRVITKTVSTSQWDLIDRSDSHYLPNVHYLPLVN